MRVNFDQIADTARVWVYQADRALTEDEIQTIKANADAFCTEWTAHNQALEAATEILHQRFLIIAVDESKTMASGCSIDKSVAFVKQAEKSLNVNFFDRTNIAFLKNDQIITEQLSALKDRFKRGEISADSITFNNLVATKQELKTNWKVKVNNSWLSKYLN